MILKTEFGGTWYGPPGGNILGGGVGGGVGVGSIREDNDKQANDTHTIIMHIVVQGLGFGEYI